MTPIRVLIDNISTPIGENALRVHTPDDPKEWAKTLALKEDIEYHGLTDPFSVRPIGDDKYEAINGSRRLTAIKLLKDEGKSEFADGYITVNVIECDEYDSLAMQLAANYHMNKTLRGKEIKAIQRLSLVKGWTIAQTAKEVGMSEDYLKKLLKTTYLPEKVQKLIGSNDMSLAAAIQLSKLPSDLVDSHVEDALSMSVAELTAKIAQTLDEYKKSIQTGKGGELEFVPNRQFIGKAEVETLLDSVEAEYQLEATDYNRGRLNVLQEIFKVDEKALSERKAEWDKKQEEKEVNKAQREEKRKAKKLEEARKLLEENS